MPLGFIGSLLGAGISAGAATSAASVQAQAAEQAAKIQQQEFQQTQTNLMPFLQAGQNLLPQLTGMLGPGGQLSVNPQTTAGPAPVFNMPQYTAAMYQASPGYNATLQGGTQALQNAGATTTGALSGNVLKALQGYGTGLANADFQQGYQNYATNYTNQFNANNQNYWGTIGQSNTYNQNLYNWLQTLIGSGQNAGASLGALGSQSAANQGNALIGGANATAAGIVGAGNAATGGLNSLSTQMSNPNNTNFLATLLNGGSGGGTGYADPGMTGYGSQFYQGYGAYGGGG